MATRLSRAGFVVLALVLGATRLGFNVAEATQQTPPAQGATQPQPPGMQDMMKMHEQMMAEMQAGDAKLDALAKDMNDAQGRCESQRRSSRRQRACPAAQGHARSHGTDASADDGRPRHDDGTLSPDCHDPALRSDLHSHELMDAPEQGGAGTQDLLFCSFAAVVAIAACNGWLARRSY